MTIVPRPCMHDKLRQKEVLENKIEEGNKFISVLSQAKKALELVGGDATQLELLLYSYQSL